MSAFPPSSGPAGMLSAAGRHFGWAIVWPSVLTLALFLALIFGYILPVERELLVDRKKEMIRELTHAAWSELAGMHAQEVAGAKTRAEAQAAAIERIRNMRYGEEGKDYFWLTDFQPRMIMHPYRPELDGQDLSTYADPTGKRLFVEFASVARAEREGYVDYLWQWKDDESRIVPKLSCVKGFAPWGWIVGTGIYLEDVRIEIERMTQNLIVVASGILLVTALLLVYLVKQGLALERGRRSAAAALRASEEKYRQLVEGSAGEMLLVLEDRPVYANPRLLARLEMSEGDLACATLDQLFGGAGRLPSGGGSFMGEERATLRAKDGRATEVLISVAPVTVGGRAGQLFTVTEIAGRQRTEDALARLIGELQSMLPLAMRSVKSLAGPLVCCPLETPVARAAAAMTRAKSSAIVVTGPEGAPLGIVTDQDLRTRVLTEGREGATPVAEVMSAPLARIPERALLFEATRLLQERELKHLVVTDERGAAVGILTATALLHAQRHAVGTLLAEIAAAPSPEALRDCRARLPVFVKALLEGGARVESLTRILTAVSDAILARLLALAEAALGAPPAPYTFIRFGSEAREEQTLATDQDNGLVYDDVESERAEAAQAWFLRLGETVCGWLDEIGYRRCKGLTMASNPKWCQPLSRWLATFGECVTSAKPQDLLDINIFFDFRAAQAAAGGAAGSGASAHVAALRGHLRTLLPADGRHAFFFHLAQSTLQFRPPRDFFGNIQLEKADAGPATFNVKAALIPLVNFARIYALRVGLGETNTLDRLRLLRERGVLLPSSHDELAQAYTTLMQMRLRHQALQVGRGEAPDNRVPLAELTQLDQTVLKNVFADIAVFQARIENDFARTI